MRPYSALYIRAFTTAARIHSSSVATRSFQSSTAVKMSSVADVPVEATNVKTASGINLSKEQKTIVGSVLDLFAGRPSLEKLKLWTDDGVFEDPINLARGREQYSAQWVRRK